ncbi:MAG: YbaB/EbfC family nucleoid-associated protein [Chloroflexota bacterium]
MGRGGFNPNQMMKQVQKMQAEMERIQEELGNKTVEATAGGGMVRVVATGKQEIKEITIAPEAVDPEDVEMLQDTIVAAVNEALRKAGELAQQDMAKVTGGMKLPF